MIKNRYKGKFVTFEGTDGSGKSTQLDLLQTDLEKYKQDSVFTKEPTNGSLGWEIYDLLNNRHKTLKLSEMPALAFQKLYFQDRRNQYRNVILPCLRGGVNVISDRGLASVVYGARDIGEINHFLGLENAMFQAKDIPFIVPDLTLIYEVDPDVAMSRLKEKRRDLDSFETREKIVEVAARYRLVAQVIPNCVFINANPSAPEVYAETRKHVFGLLGISE